MSCSLSKTTNLTLHEHLATYFADPFASFEEAETIDLQRGRKEVRHIKLTSALSGYLQRDWPGVAQVAQLTRTVTTKKTGKTTSEVVYIITTLSREHGLSRKYVARAPLEGSDDRQLMATLRTGEPAPSPSLVRVASAHSFIPELSSSARPIRGEVPMPEGRPYSLGIARQTWPRLMPRPRCPPPAACGPAAGSCKIRARSRMTMMALMRPMPGLSMPGLFPLTRRSIRVVPASCWPDAGSIEPGLSRHFP